MDKQDRDSIENDPTLPAGGTSHPRTHHEGDGHHDGAHREGSHHASDATDSDAIEPNPPRTVTGKFAAPKFGSAGGGGAELEPGPERD